MSGTYWSSSKNLSNDNKHWCLCCLELNANFLETESVFVFVKVHVFPRRPLNLTKSSPSIWHLLHTVKSTMKILSIFVAFLENMNFTEILWQTFWRNKWRSVIDVVKDYCQYYFWIIMKDWWNQIGKSNKSRSKLPRC